MRARLIAVAACCAILGLGLAVRAFAGGAFGQHAGTALYAAMIYAGIYVLAPEGPGFSALAGGSAAGSGTAPATRPWVAGAVAVTFCWIVEFAQLTGVPADLAERSQLARLVLGAQFDPTDLLWYVLGVVPIAAMHSALVKLSYPRPTVEP
ncbi:DUF2809 domain-containing protein [Actinoplanes sp. NPDC051633]|uniref:ribosomal maturation YjgA family protein n=1 Tax=Actinoplanes sp. NPDC051633 TaxID=3155670 RepID=UPI003423D5D2